MMAVITAMEFPRDLQGAEAMMSRWKEHRAEVDSRKEAVKKFLDSGQTMIDDKHFLSEEVGEIRTGPEVIKLFSCSTQLSMNFIMLINVKMPTIICILTCQQLLAF